MDKLPSAFERVTLTKINEHVYLMDDAHESTGYIVVGSEKAAVIDTMNGYANVSEVVKSVTDLPAFVINTHGHGDHIFGNIYFEETYIHPDDKALAEEFSQRPEFANEIKKYGMKMPPFMTVKEGDSFDLGGIHLDIYDLPGHTRGGILILDREDRILFTGDGINRHLWMQLDHSLPMETLIKSLERVSFLKEKADYICHGHARGTDPIALFDDLYRGAKEIVAGKTSEDKPYVYFGGECLQHEFAEGSVIVYNKLQ